MFGSINVTKNYHIFLYHTCLRCLRLDDQILRHSLPRLRDFATQVEMAMGPRTPIPRGEFLIRRWGWGRFSPAGM
jgi:hypothetical protein